MNIEGKERKIIFGVFVILILANAFAWEAVWQVSAQKYLKVVFFNVGQGDSIFIQTPKNQQILIDGGPDSSVLAELGKVMPFYDRSLDLVILTHPEKDHLDGLLEVLKRYQIDNILWTGVVRDTDEWRAWQNEIKNYSDQIKIAEAGERLVLDGGKDGPYIDILNPSTNLSGEELKDSNDTGVVSHLIFGEKSFLFTADISSKIENLLLGGNLKSDVLKIAHHGSKYSSEEKFIRDVAPKISVIEVGKNSYGHPSPDVLARLQNFGIDVLRTDTNGDVTITTDGINLNINKNK